MAASASTSFTAGPSFAGVDGLLETEKNSEEPENTYILRPIFQQRFRPSVVKDCIHAVLKEELANAEYSAEETPQLTKHLSENIKDKLKDGAKESRCEIDPCRKTLSKKLCMQTGWGSACL
ncbi:dynein light chain Tctex-type protein 2B isoform X2 [Cavia porcellus]|uniref:dynein light chain Tctex-type protein 2B isoform X2 n=1 Tax=Cavia porcellus TaxID=10141 RepID=UPI002FE18445